jgi:hypothetical protein
MSIVKVILTGFLVWFLGVSFYSISYFIPIIENIELQSNLILAITLIPNAWFGAKLYYRKGHKMSGAKLASSMLLVAVLLDIIITVPYLIIPYGGTYQSFFGGISFWLIAIEYFFTIYLYWLFKVKS